MTEEKSKLQRMRDKFDTIDALIDTLDVHHHEAYTSAAEKHLKDEKGEIDYKRLKEGKVQQDVAQTMVDFYVEKAKTKLGIPKEKKLSEEEIDMLLSAYANITKGELLELLREYKDDFKLATFSQHVRDPQKGLLARVSAKMMPSATSHIEDTEKDKRDIIKAMGLEGKIDPKYITRQQVLKHAASYHKNKGVISPGEYEDEVYAMKGKK